MAVPSVAEIAIDRGLLIKNLVGRLKVSQTPDNLNALVAINVALNELLAVAQRRCSDSELQQKRRQQQQNADDIFLPKQADRG